jgi:hypothetical protein
LNANKVAATPKAIFVFVNIIWFDPRFKALGWKINLFLYNKIHLSFAIIPAKSI